MVSYAMICSSDPLLLIARRRSPLRIKQARKFIGIAHVNGDRPWRQIRVDPDLIPRDIDDKAGVDLESRVILRRLFAAIIMCAVYINGCDTIFEKVLGKQLGSYTTTAFREGSETESNLCVLAHRRVDCAAKNEKRAARSRHARLRSFAIAPLRQELSTIGRPLYLCYDGGRPDRLLAGRPLERTR